MDNMENEQETDTKKRQIHRSPNYPGLNLSEAIERARIIYGAEKRAFTSAEVLACDLSLTAGTGPANRVISALRQYGLLDEDSGNLGISDLGFNVIHLSDSPDRDELIKQAARRPPLISEILTRFPSGLPSDASIKDFLIKQKKFNPASVDFFVKILRKTVTFAKLDGTTHDEASGDLFPNVEAVPRMEIQEKLDDRLIGANASMGADIPYFRFTLKGATVEFRASAPLSKEHFDLIRAHLRAYEPGAQEASKGDTE
jgi:hypothetical protein